MAQKIRVLVVDDFADARESIVRLLNLQEDMETVGTAADGLTAIAMARYLRPDVVVLDLNLPDNDGIQVAETITREMPLCHVIMMSIRSEAEYIRRAMVAGARDYLIKPFSGEELVSTIRRLYAMDADRRARIASLIGTPQQAAQRKGKIVCVFSPKGGVGRTSICTNLAIAVHRLTRQRVVLADFNLYFGDVGIMLNLDPRKCHTMDDLLPSMSDLSPEVLDSVLVHHSSGIRVLLAPPRPEQGELFTADHVRRILAALRESFDYVLVDTWNSFHDTMLTIFDDAQQILLLTTVDMPAIKNIRMFLELSEKLGHPPSKICLVLNRADSTGGISIADVEAATRRQVYASLVSAGQLVTASINNGVPFVISDPDAPISRNVMHLASLILTDEDKARLPANHTPQSTPAPAHAVPRIRLPIFFRKGAT